MKTLKWGIIGTGSIAEAFARGLTQTDSGTAFAVGSRHRKSGADFAETYRIERAFTGYDSLLADPEVEAVYISTPHPFHAEWARKAARAGKHVLCEKPADRTSYAYEADITAAAAAAGRQQASAPAMTWEDTLGNFQVLDEWRSEIGLVYPGEK